MSKPHKHAALIHAWADGAEIEYCPVDNDVWQPMPTPQWSLIGDYRIKPVSKLDVAIEALEDIARYAPTYAGETSQKALNKIRSME